MPFSVTMRDTLTARSAPGAEERRASTEPGAEVAAECAVLVAVTDTGSLGCLARAALEASRPPS